MLLASAGWIVLGESALYIGVGAILLLVSFWITDRLTPGRLWEEIAKKNMALAVLTAGSWIGDALIIAAVIGSGNGDVDHSLLLPLSSVLWFNVLANTIVYAVIGMAAKTVLYIGFDVFTPQVRFSNHLRDGNVALGALLGGLFIALSVVIAAPLGG